MSALIFSVNSEQAIVATDTLACTPDGAPAFFCHKAFHIPELSLLIAGTGYWNVIQRFVSLVGRLAERIEGIEQLAENVTPALQDLWAAFSQSEPGIEHTTIYLFGVSERSQEIAAYAFRAPDGFAAERLPPCVAYKPGEGIDPPEVFTFECIPSVMEEMRAHQAKEPDPSKRIHIGGQIEVFNLLPERCEQWILHTFPDYDEVKQQMPNGGEFPG